MRSSWEIDLLRKLLKTNFLEKKLMKHGIYKKHIHLGFKADNPGDNALVL